MTIPTNGADRCDCGCKYWTDGRCFDCGTHYDVTTEGIARALFETDPSARWEADWHNLASYKRDDWMRLAETY